MLFIPKGGQGTSFIKGGKGTSSKGEKETSFINEKNDIWENVIHSKGGNGFRD